MVRQSVSYSKHLVTFSCVIIREYNSLLCATLIPYLREPNKGSEEQNSSGPRYQCRVIYNNPFPPSFSLYYVIGWQAW